MALRAFTFGTSLWTGASPLLFEATAAVERERGFAPPLLVDVSADGHQEECAAPAFEPVDPTRALALAPAPELDLGKRLLTLARERAAKKQHIVLACACWVNRADCRRHGVAQEMLAAAANEGTSLEICEWPGGEPTSLEVELAPLDVTRIARGALSLRVPLPMARAAGLPWGSLVRGRCATREACFLSGPAQPAHGELVLPVYSTVDENVDLDQLRREMTRDFLLAPRKAGG